MQATKQSFHRFLGRFSLILIVAVWQLAGIQAVESTADGVLRWRVMADSNSRISFRVPFTYTIPDMYHPGLTRDRVGRRATVTGEEAAGMTPEEVRALLQERLRNPQAGNIDYDVELFFRAREELGDLADQPLAEAAAAIAELPEMEWQDFDYYEVTDHRPQANQSWAVKNITAKLGDSEQRSALVLSYDQGIAVVVCTGSLSAHDNAHIFNTVEVMVENRKELQTYRHGTALRGMVVDHQGAIIRAPRTSDVRVHEGWGIETAHYHIISNTSGRHLQQYATMMEVLYDAFHKTYMPDRLPLFKMEVAVWASQEEMGQAAAATGVGPLGPGVLGFFAPGLLNIMAYETGSTRGDFTTFATLAHEASHQFLHMTCNGSRHVPTWINEGLAVYFESCTFKGGRLNIQIPKARIERLKRLYPYNNNRMLWSPDVYLSHYGHIPGDNYGEVYLKTHFWLFGVKGGRERFQEYWKALLRGEDGTQAFEEIFMKDIIARFGSRAAALLEIEKMIVQYINSIR